MTGICLASFASPLALRAQTWDEPMQSSADPTSNADASDYDPDIDEALFLLVSINGRDTGLVAEFALSHSAQRMSAQRKELEGIGIAAPRALGRTVYLDQIPGLSFYYDAPSQAILIAAQTAILIPVEISAMRHAALPETQTGYGLVLNYRVTTNLGDDVLEDGFQPAEAFAGLEVRAFTPLGVLTTTGSVASVIDDLGNSDNRRYDTFFTVSSPRRLVTATIGDFTAAGLAWTRPVRLGGLQVRRDFSLRDDLVTSPLLSHSGTAAVPSSIDVYVDNVRAYSGAVAAGPFNLSDVPMITSGGEAVFILRDAGGNEQVTMVPFFATQNLLPRGMVDFSIAAGRARANYGVDHFNYGDSTAAAASLRYGISDRLTVEAHGEVLDDLRMGGLGFGTVLFNRAEVTLAGGTSQTGSAKGSFFFGALRTDVAEVGVRFSTRRTFGDYRDLASVMARAEFGPDRLDSGVFPHDVIKAQDALSLTVPVFGNAGSLGLSLINSERIGLTNTILSVSYSRRLSWRSASYRVNAFEDLAGDGGYGISVRVSMPLGASSHASAGLLRDRYGDIDAVTSLSRPADRRAGSYGYRINLARRTNAIGATYQSRYGRADLALRDSGQGAGASATFDGALVMAGGGLFASNRVYDGFAVVDVGVADVPVRLNNRVVTSTGLFGKAMVPDLRSYRRNKISINPLDLPIDANIGATAMDVVPARRSGVVVDFGGTTQSAALVVLRDTDGVVLAPGATVRLKGSRAEFTVGYDGEVWIEGLGARNRITAQTGTGPCSAEFDYADVPGEQVYIESLECR